MRNDIFTPHIPLFSQARDFIRIAEGSTVNAIRSLLNAMFGQVGTPQNPVDWSEPDNWISERLREGDALLARRIWQESNHHLNPRYIQGAFWFTNSVHELLLPDPSGYLRFTERGQRFLANDAATVREIDAKEGLLALLEILATKGEAQRGDILPEWSEYLAGVSNYRKPGAIQNLLWGRMRILVERGFVQREAISYAITPDGLQYISTTPKMQPDPRRSVLSSIKQHNDGLRQALRDRLSTMHPYQFEQLIGSLLEAMGYENVQVTQQSGDKGVDVVATAQFGITTVTEAIQVKRHQGNIGRPILDQLRGTLHRWNAIRGTIITLGAFSKGCAEAAIELRAAPITLIDGERLLELLIEHEIGIRKRPAMLYEFDEAFLAETSATEELVEALARGASLDTL